MRKAGKQVLLIASGERVFAVANRCPHEGYPFSEGTEGPDCVLTCNWHNWKFDLATGAALVGRDPVRTYPVELRNGEIFVDLADPPAEAQKRARTARAATPRSPTTTCRAWRAKSRGWSGPASTRASR